MAKKSIQWRKLKLTLYGESGCYRFEPAKGEWLTVSVWPVPGGYEARVGLGQIQHAEKTPRLALEAALREHQGQFYNEHERHERLMEFAGALKLSTERPAPKHVCPA